MSFMSVRVFVHLRCGFAFKSVDCGVRRQCYCVWCLRHGRTDRCLQRCSGCFALTVGQNSTSDGLSQRRCGSVREGHRTRTYPSGIVGKCCVSPPRLQRQCSSKRLFCFVLVRGLTLCSVSVPMCLQLQPNSMLLAQERRWEPCWPIGRK